VHAIAPPSTESVSPESIRRRSAAPAAGARRIRSETLDRLLSRPLGATGGALWSGRLGSPSVALRAREAGDRVGNYAIVEEIGRGGTSVVYRARRCDGVFEHEVALKIVHSTPSLRGRARLERNILGRLRHPNIAQIIDGGESPAGEIWFAMELATGEHIDARCTNLRLDWSARVRLVIQVCDAIEHAHAQSVIHGDIKPGNIIVGANNRVSLVDFGISSAATDESANDAAAGESALTPGFASPEQFSGEPMTPASDLFQIGRVIEELVASARDVPEPVARNLAAIVSKATRFKAGQRYENAAALRADLECVLALRLCGARRWSFARRLQLLALRKRESLPAFAAVALVAVLCIGLAIPFPFARASGGVDSATSAVDDTKQQPQSIGTILGADSAGQCTAARASTDAVTFQRFADEAKDVTP
jgi:eukaryotic-like serine/threonine-protein kinase